MFEINRSDSIYQEIESFEEYSYTNCITYEMAIRNDDLKKELSTYTEEDFRKPPIGQDRNIRQEKFKKIGIKYFFDVWNYLEMTYSGERYSSRKLNNTSYGSNTNVFLRNKIKDITEFEVNIKRRPFRKPGLLDNRKPNNNSNISILKKIHFSKDFLSISTEGSFYQYKLFLIQSRPNMYIPRNFDVQSLNLNLALPEEELLLLLKIYKKEFDRNNSLLRNQDEIKGQEINRTGNKIKINDKEIIFNKHINTRDKVADMFFIYDAIKIGMRKSQITNSITLNYYNRYERGTTFDNKTLNKYLKIAQLYIDELKYKELLTNINFD